MTPTTAEQMPDWQAIAAVLFDAQARERLEGFSDYADEIEKLYTGLQSWLAQGGARGGDKRAIAWAEETPYGRGVSFNDEGMEIFGHCKCAPVNAAALAPRAEAGEAVQMLYSSSEPPSWDAPAAQSQDLSGTISSVTIHSLMDLARWLNVVAPGSPEKFEEGVATHMVNICLAMHKRMQEPPQPSTPEPTAACGVSGLVTDAMVDAALKAMSESTVAFFNQGHVINSGDSHWTYGAMRAALTAALNAGALAGGS